MTEAQEVELLEAVKKIEAHLASLVKMTTTLTHLQTQAATLPPAPR